MGRSRAHSTTAWSSRSTSEILPRGYRFELDGRSFVFLGGASSGDLNHRTSGHDCRPQEAITAEDIKHVIDGGYGTDAAGPRTPSPTPGSEPSTCTFLVRLRLLAHGHYHVADDATVAPLDIHHPTRIWSLNCDSVDGDLRYLRLDTLDAPDHTLPEGP